MTDEKFAEFLNDRVDEWHDGPIPLELHQHLRMSWEEYVKWTTSNILPVGMKARWGF